MKKSFNSYSVTELTRLFLFYLEFLIPATIGIFVLRHISTTDTTVASYVMRTKTVFACKIAWIVWGVSLLWLLLSGYYKKVLFRVDHDGLAFSKEGYYYEFEWDEIEYSYEKTRAYFAPVLCIKTYGKDIPYNIDFDGYMWTHLSVRIAFRHFSEGRTPYYTKREWKRRINSS